MYKRMILSGVVVAIIAVYWWATMQHIQKISDDDVFICVDTVRKCKIYVSPDTLHATGNASFDVVVKQFFYDFSLVNQDKVSFWKEDGVVWCRFDDNGMNLKISDDDSYSEIWNYGLNSLNLEK